MKEASDNPRVLRWIYIGFVFLTVLVNMYDAVLEPEKLGRTLSNLAVFIPCMMGIWFFAVEMANLVVGLWYVLGARKAYRETFEHTVHGLTAHERMEYAVCRNIRHDIPAGH